MRVLHVIDSLDITRGGLPGALDLILKMEQKFSVSHEVLTLRSNSGVPVKDIGLPIDKIHFFSPSFPARFSNSSECFLWLDNNRTKFDLIVIHAIWYVLAVRIGKWAHKNNVKYVVWPHGSLSPYDLKKKSLLKKVVGPLLVRQFLSNASAVICTGEMEKDIMVTYGAKANIVMLPLPVDYSEPSAEQLLNSSPATILPDDEFLFLFMCRISYVKRLDLVLEALSVLKDKGIRAKLIIAGAYENKTFESKHRAIIQRLGIENQVLHTGWVDSEEKYRLFKNTHCFVLPSMGENFGIVLVEALQSGLPVILSRNVSIWKTIVDSKSGIATDPSVESLVTAMEKVISDKALLAELKSNTTKTAALFKSENLVAIYRNAYSNFV
jgi:glycosyltransferase involved in cell wall biosynthesis